MSRNAEFIASTHANGGATMNLHTGEQYTGKGYTVGGATNKKGQQIPTVSIPPRELTEQRVAEHSQRILDETGGHKSAAIGSWVNEGQVHLDAVDTVMSPVQAQILAHKRGEKAIYDHAKGRDIKTWGRAIR